MWMGASLSTVLSSTTQQPGAKQPATVANAAALITDGNWSLTHEGDTSQLKLDTKRFLVDPFEKPGAQPSVHFDCRTDNRVGMPVDLISRLLDLGVLGVLAVHTRMFGRSVAYVSPPIPYGSSRRRKLLAQRLKTSTLILLSCAQPSLAA
jgi:hypothetical protein